VDDPDDSVPASVLSCRSILCHDVDSLPSSIRFLAFTDQALYDSQSVDLQFAEQVVQRLVSAGHTAYFAGGCVRDALMGTEPHDFDVATSATTDQVRAVFGPENTRAVGEAFGVVLVHRRIQGQTCQVEVASFRTDGSYSDGRRPDWVALATPEEDASRRDFTINGLFYDPIAKKVIDFVGGQADLERRVLRSIGVPADRFREDKLRLLRAVRFAGRFGFELESETQRAVEQFAPQIVVVSGERIGVELKKILEHPSRAWAWEKLIETGLTEYLLPELHHRWTSLGDRHHDLRVLKELAGARIDWTSSIAAIALPWFLEHRSEDAIEALLEALKERWKMANVEVDALGFAIRQAESLIAASQRPWSEVQPLLISSFAAPALDVAEALAKAYSHELLGIQLCRERLKWPRNQLDPSPWIRGDDLIAMGLKPSRAFAELLSEARALQLDEHLRDRDTALEWLQEAIRQRSDRKG
jgi:tRNA nucleotidyltransferase/poly(A) polymerase